MTPYNTQQLGYLCQRHTWFGWVWTMDEDFGCDFGYGGQRHDEGGMWDENYGWEVCFGT